MQSSDLLFHLAAALLVGSALMRSLRAVRLLAISAGLAAIGSSLVAGGQEAVMAWAAVFVAVSAAQVALSARRMRLGDMRAEERALLENILRVEDPARQRRLIGLLTWRDAEPGEVLIRQGQDHPPLIYVASGAAGIELDGRLVGVAGAGDFLGDMSVATGEPASTAVVVTNAMRIAVVDRAALAQMAEVAPEIGAAFDGAINRALAAKIRRMNEAAASQARAGS